MSEQHSLQDWNKRLSYSASKPSYYNYGTEQRQYSIGFQQRARLPRVPSEKIVVRTQRMEQPNLQQTRIPSRRQNQMITNLKSQLQNIKSQVAKLINKDQVVQSPTPVEHMEREQINNVVDKFGENSSVSSIVISRKIKNRMQAQPTDKEQYVLLENEILKSELKNLKNKYIMKKTQQKQQTTVLRKKIMFLQGIIEKREQQLIECKEEIDKQISIIRRNMINQNQLHNQGYNNPLRSPIRNTITQISSSQSIHINQSQQFHELLNQLSSLKQQNIYLKKRVAEATEQIKQMAIQNNQLSIQLKRNYTQPSLDFNEIQQIKLQYENKINQQNVFIENQNIQIHQINSQFQAACQEANKSVELNHLINCQRQNYERLQGTLNFKIQQLSRAEERIQSFNGLEENYCQLNNKFQQSLIKQQTLTEQITALKNDLNELSSVLMAEKMKNQDLSFKLQQLSNKQNTDNHEAQLKYQEAEKQLQEYKVNVRSMIVQTAEKINYLEVENENLKGQIQEICNRETTNVEALRQQNQQLKQMIGQLKQKQIVLENKQCLTQIESSGSQSDLNSFKIEEQTIKIQILERRIQDLEVQKSVLYNSLESKDREIDVLRIDNIKLQEIYLTQNKEYQNIKLSYQLSLNQLRQKQSEFQQRLIQANNKTNELQTNYLSQIKQSSEVPTDPNNIRNQNVDETIKTQADCIDKLRSIISHKNEQIQSFRENSTLLSTIVDNLKQQLEQHRNKTTSQKQIIRDSYQSQISTYQNSLNVSNQIICQLEHKIKLITEESSPRVSDNHRNTPQNTIEPIMQIEQSKQIYQKKVDHIVSQTYETNQLKEALPLATSASLFTNPFLSPVQPQAQLLKQHKQITEIKGSEMLSQNNQI